MNANELYAKAATFYVNQKFDDAKKFALKALLKDKKHSPSLNLLGSISFALKDYELAKSFFEKAIHADKLNSLAYNNIGKLYTELKNYQKAKDAFLQSINLSPEMLDPYFNIACLLLEEKNYTDAKEFFLKTLELDASFEKSYLSLGIIEKELKNYDSSLMYLTLAIKQNQNSALAFSNLANVLFELKQIERAKAAAFKSIELDANSAICYSNLSIILNACNDLQNAAKCLQKAHELEPQNQKIATNFALTLFALNDYENGLKLFRQREISRLVCDRPIWNGEELHGKTIVVYSEQGLGDTVNFARFLTKLNASKIYFIPQDELLSLFKNSLFDVTVISKREFLAANILFDYHCALFDIMDICKLYKPIPNINFININQEKQTFFKSILPNKKLKIGIAWQGNKNHINDTLRSCALADFAKLAALKDVLLVSLQKDVDLDEVANFKQEHELLETSNYLKDFDDTAALIACLDVVISIDTSVAHIAATQNKPVWLLCALSPDWRWHAAEENRWYECVRIFKKQEMFNWDSVFDAVVRELKKIQL